jgi:hypothetical protein
VARQAGLKSSDRLRRLFQQAYGVTPADYRNDKSSPLVRTHDAKPAPTTLPERFARLSYLHAKIIVSLPMRPTPACRWRFSAGSALDGADL